MKPHKLLFITAIALSALTISGSLLAEEGQHKPIFINFDMPGTNEISFHQHERKGRNHG